MGVPRCEDSVVPVIGVGAVELFSADARKLSADAGEGPNAGSENGGLWRDG